MPDPLPEGYAMPRPGQLECADLWIGEANLSCTVQAPYPACGAPTVFVGCEKLLPCAPQRIDTCAYNSSGCEDVMPNTTCEIKCNAPYVGDSTFPRCPNDNLDPSQPLLDRRPIAHYEHMCIYIYI